MNAREYNRRVAELARHQPLRGARREGGGGSSLHKWRVEVEPAEGAADFGRNPLTGEAYFSASVFAQPENPAVGQLWRVHVGTGCVNDEPAAIEYRRTGDPRGWEMPPGYPPFERLRAAFGDSYPFVDRPMWEEPRPFLLVTAPNADASDLGGFTRVSNGARPESFRTAEAWECDLYRASVWVTVGFWRADPAFDLIRPASAPQRRFRRWRVAAGRLPVPAEGIRIGDARELATLYLLRLPGHPEDDTIEVRQRVFWDLRARSVAPTLNLANALEALELGTLGVTGLGAVGLAAGTALLAAETLLAEAILDNLNAILDSASGTEFWSV